MFLRRKITGLLPDLKTYATALSKDLDKAEDLVQEAVKRALTAKKVPEDLGEVKPWMFRIIRNIHIDNVRKEKTHREYSADPARLSEESGVKQPRVIEEILLRQALIDITEMDREIIYLIDVLGLKYSEAAVVLGVAIGTVMSRISRARRSLILKMEETNVKPFERRQKYNDNK
jgi:RNA polymerase sigma-70 factor, ECF subfamily